MSLRYCLMARERESSVFAVDSANLISGLDFITRVELASMAVLAEANGVKKSVVMKTRTIEKINRREMCFMFALFSKWIVVGRDTFVYISSYHRISTEEMPSWHRALKISECGSRIADLRLQIVDWGCGM